jgi:hypothetical protein
MWITAITMEWVRHPANAYFQRRLKDRQTYFVLEKDPKPTHAEFQIELQTLQDVQQKGFARRTTDNLAFAQEVAEALGLKKGELERISGVM